MASGQDDTVASSLPAATASASELPAVLAGRYQLARWLGGGGMGRVYEVVDLELGERVALKVLRAGLTDDALERFRREVRLTRRIQHRNVARMFDIGEHDGHRFLTMELIAGAPLTVELGAPMPWPRLRALALQICAGLAAAHEVGVIHRDLKPDNVLVERASERVVLTDFGIARGADDAPVTHVGTVIGTPRYMAPEQLAGTSVDARADVFSLGVMLYEMATGARPWAGDNPIHLAVAQATTPPRAFEAPMVPREIEDLVLRCLRLDREARPPSVAEIGAVLAACAADGPTRRPARAAPPTAAPQLAPATGASIAATVAEGTTLAVLPLACGPEDGYLADGVREELVDVLSMTPTLRVRPAGGAPADAAQDPRARGRELEVEHVIAGGVRRTPHGLRVAARLIGVADGFQIWAQRRDCTEADLLEVAGALAAGIAEALSTRAASAARPLDPRAVDLYLRARAELRRFWGEYAESAVALLDQALAFAPGSPQLLGASALAHVQAWMRTGTDELRARAQAAVTRGLATGLGEAHLAAAILHLNQGELEQAAGAFGVALARAPMAAQAHEGAARLLVEIGAVEEGRRHFETALGLDPGRAQLVAIDVLRLDALERNWGAAERQLAQLLADPDPPVARLGRVMEVRLALWRRDVPRLVEAVKFLGPKVIGEADAISSILFGWQATGALDHARWDAVIAPFRQPGPPRRFQVVMLQRLVEMALVMAQPEAALRALRASVDVGLLDLLWFDRCPLLADLADHPALPELRAVVAERAARLLAMFRRAGA